MPLHLLGKKSWNVYNADSIARVQRDEAAARAAKEAEEQRMQERDAERRLAILRGEAPPPLNDDVRETEASRSAFLAASPRNRHDGRTHRSRKRQGEDDTDFEMRLAREKNDLAKHASGGLPKPVSSAPIVDTTGHIDLIGREEGNGGRAEKKQFERDSRQRQRAEREDQFNMRFSNAAGKDAPSQPWYAHVDMEAATMGAPSTDVWGNEDGGRKQRQAQRLATDDPLALMKKGVSRVRELRQERQRGQQERDEELRALQRDHRDRGREKGRREEKWRRHRTQLPSGQSDHYRRRSRDRHESSRERGSHGNKRRRNHERSRDRRH